jgi:hypothetical protein
MRRIRVEGLDGDQPLFSDRFQAFLDERHQDRATDLHIIAGFDRYEPDLTKDDAIIFLDIKRDDEGRSRITYTTPRRVKTAPHEPFAPKGHRISAKPGSIAQRLSNRTDGRELDFFVAQLTGFLAPQPNVELWPGSRVHEAYQTQNNCKCGSRTSLHSSCRRDATPATLAFHIATGEILVTLCLDCQKVRSRTMIWTDFYTGLKAADRTFGGDADRTLVNAFVRDIGGFVRSDIQGSYGVPLPGVVFNAIAHGFQIHSATDYDYLPAYDTMKPLCSVHNIFGVGHCRLCRGEAGS